MVSKTMQCAFSLAFFSTVAIGVRLAVHRVKKHGFPCSVNTDGMVDAIRILRCALKTTKLCLGEGLLDS